METLSILQWAILVVGAYLLGSIPFAQVLARLRGMDLREVGTGNVGAGNLKLQTNWRWGLAAGLLDAAKGFVPVFVGDRLGLGPGAAVFAGTAAVAGHNWSVFLRGRSGRGLATAAGMILALDPWLLVWVGGWSVAGLKIGGGLGGFIGWGLLPAVSAAMGRQDTESLALLALSGLLMFRRAQGNPDSDMSFRAIVQRIVFDTDRASELVESSDKPISP